MTPEQILLLNLAINNAVRAITARVNTMTPDEVEFNLNKEKERNEELMAELNDH